MARGLLIVPTIAGVDLARTRLGLVRALGRRGVNEIFPVIFARRMALNLQR